MGKMKATIDDTKAAAATAASDEPGVILFGTDEAGKAHASRFPIADLELVERAAGLMGFRVLKVTTPAMRAAASELPIGRIFGGSGKAFTPFVRMAAHEALCGFEGAYMPAAPAEPQPAPPVAVGGTPRRWEDISVGSLVLATTGPGDGWYEAVVAEDRGEALFVLRWQGWPDHDPFVRRADGLALLPVRAAEAPVAA